MLQHQTITLLVAVLTLAATIILYFIIPKGFFPVQDTGIIQGISEANETISSPRCPSANRRSPKSSCRIPRLRAFRLSSAWTARNTTLNSGRILINLKPLGDRGIDATQVIRRLQPELAKVEGIQLYMQPVQDLTVEDRVRPHAVSVHPGRSDQNELNEWTAKLVAKLQQIPELRDVATTSRTTGVAAALVIDRVTASRLGITPTVIDQTLYDGFGQRQVSTLYTQLNQYHLILETLPEFQKNPAKLHDIYVRSALANSNMTTSSTSVITASSSTGSGTGPSPSANSSAGTSSGSSNPTPSPPSYGAAVPLSAITHFETRSAPLSVNHQGQFPVVTISFNLAQNASLGNATKAIEKAQQDIGMPLSIQAAFRAQPRRSRRR